MADGSDASNTFNFKIIKPRLELSFHGESWTTITNSDHLLLAPTHTCVLGARSTFRLDTGLSLRVPTGYVLEVRGYTPNLVDLTLDVQSDAYPANLRRTPIIVALHNWGAASMAVRRNVPLAVLRLVASIPLCAIFVAHPPELVGDEQSHNPTTAAVHSANAQPDRSAPSPSVPPLPPRPASFVKEPTYAEVYSVEGDSDEPQRPPGELQRSPGEPQRSPGGSGDKGKRSKKGTNV